VILQNSEDRFTWNTEVDLGIAFAVWVLLVDGLKIPPFDRHNDGDSQLRAAGLVASGWSDWIQAMVTGQLRIKTETDQENAWPATNTWRSRKRSRNLISRVPEGPNAWGGNPEVGRLLRLLWKSYQPKGNAWRWNQPLPLDQPDAAKQAELWRFVQSNHGRIGTLCDYVVEYPEPVVYIVPPSSLIVGCERNTITWDVYASLISRGVSALAAQ
jgi:hypothetical protein